MKHSVLPYFLVVLVLGCSAGSGRSRDASSAPASDVVAAGSEVAERDVAVGPGSVDDVAQETADARSQASLPEVVEPGATELPPPTATVLELRATNATAQVTPGPGTPESAMLGVAFAEHPMPTLEDHRSAEVSVAAAAVPVGFNTELRPLTRYYFRPYARLGDQVAYGQPLDPVLTPFLEVKDSYGGGRVVHVDNNAALILHYSATETPSAFGCNGVEIEYPSGGNGRDKADAILRACPDAPAARYCADLEAKDGVTGWHLADKSEMAYAKGKVPIIPTTSFWLSDPPTSVSFAKVWTDGTAGDEQRTMELLTPCVGHYFRRTRGVPTGLTDITAPSADDTHPGGAVEHCTSVACDAGQSAVGGGGYYPLGRFVSRASPSLIDYELFERCLVGKSDSVEPATTKLKAACVRVEGKVLRRVKAADVEAGQTVSLAPTCAADEVLIGGGGGAADFKLTASQPMNATSSGEWFVSGIALAATQVRAVALCAKSTERPVRVSRKVTLALGGQCTKVECPEGTHVLTGGADWAAMEPGESRRGGPADWVVCATNPGGETLSLAALCTPVPVP